MSQNVEDIKPCFPLFREQEYRDNLANKKATVRRGARRREDPRSLRVDHHRGIQDAELPARSADHQPGEGLSAAGGGAVCPGLREDAALRAWLAGVRRLLPHLLQPPLQGADLLRLRFDDRGRGGLRRPEEHVRGPGERQGDLQARHDRRQHDLHGRGHRRRPQRLHQQCQGQRPCARGLTRCPSPTRRALWAATSPAGTTCSRESSATSPSTPWRASSRAPTGSSTSCPASRPTWATSASSSGMLTEMDVPLHLPVRPDGSARHPGRRPVPHVCRRHDPGRGQGRAQRHHDASAPALAARKDRQIRREHLEARGPRAAHSDGPGMDRPVADEGLGVDRQADPARRWRRSAAGSST